MYHLTNTMIGIFCDSICDSIFLSDRPEFYWFEVMNLYFSMTLLRKSTLNHFYSDTYNETVACFLRSSNASVDCYSLL